MEIQKSSGIVLASRSSGEADRIARVYTREFGKRNFVFKGIRKSRKRSVAATEAGTVLGMVYYHHDEREFAVASEFTIRRQHHEVRGDLGKILFLFLLLEAVDKTTGYNDPNPPVYELLGAALETLCESSHAEHLSVFFLIHLLRIDGVLPDLSRCKGCGASDLKRFALDYADLAPLCPECAPAAGASPRLLSARVSDFVRRSPTTKFGRLDLASCPRGEMLDALFSLCLFLEGYFHVRLKSKDMVFSSLASGKNA